MALDPGKLTNNLIADYTSYLSSRFHFRHEGLRRQFADLLGGQRRLHSGPFLELMPPFDPGATIRDLVAAHVLDQRVLELPPDALYPDRPLYLHQQQAIEKIQAQRNVVVATGTGSGKTETYVLPILSHLLATANERGRAPRVRALLVYPMNALANDQLRRIRQLIAFCPQLTVGRYTGETPKERDRGFRRFREMWPHEPVIPNELKSREEMWATPPDILITNFAMLEYLLVRPQDSVFFDRGAADHLRFLVLDEVHTYDGAKGTEIAMLLRRLKDRIGLSDRGKLRCVATSATLGGGSDFPDVATFAAELFEEPFEWTSHEARRDVLEAVRVPYQRPTEIWPPCSITLYEEVAASLDAAPADRVARFVAALSTSAIPEHARSAAVAALGKPSASTPPGDATAEWDWKTAASDVADSEEPTSQQWALALWHALRGDSRIVALNEACGPGARALGDVEPVVVPESDVDGETRRRAVLSLITLGSMARHDEGQPALVRARYHFFLRALEGGFVCLGDHAGSGPRLFLERRTTCTEHPDHRTFEVGVCRRCGETYLVGSIARDEAARPCIGSEDPTQDALDDADESHGRLYLAFTSSGDAEADEDELGEDTTTGDDFIALTICGRCGVYADRAADGFCGCGRHAQPIDVLRVKTRNGDAGACPSCSARAWHRQVVQTLYTGTDEPVAEIATTVYQSSNAEFLRGRGEKKKLLTFSDSRQDAAFFAPYLETLYKTALRRHVVLEMVEGSERPIALDDLAARLDTRLEAYGWLGAQATADTVRREAWRWVLGEALHTSKDRRSLEELGLVSFSLRTFADVRPPAPLLRAPWNFTGVEAWTVVEILLNTLREHFVMTPPAGLKADDQVFLPARGDVSIAVKRAEGDARTRSWVPQLSFLSNTRLDFLYRVVQRRGIAVSATDLRRFLQELFERYMTASDSAFVQRYYDRHANDARRGIVYQLAPRGWQITSAAQAGIVYQCTRCGVRSFRNLSGVCPTYKCDGELIEDTGLSADRASHYRKRYRDMGALWMVAREHTAQLDSETAAGYQNLFFSGGIDVLSCSTTFELGVDLGELETVLLRNVPPTPANYAQRAGRAGRRTGAAAFVVSYAQRRSHDLTYFNEPLRMISGRVRPPSFRIDNERVVRRHLYATAWSAFFQAHPEAFGTGQMKHLFGGDGGVGTLVPLLESFLGAHPHGLGDSLQRVVPKSLYGALGVNDWSWVERLLRTGTTSIDRLNQEYTRECAYYVKAEQESSESGNHKRAGLYQWIRRTVQMRHLLGVLANHGLFPKYGFPVDVVGLEVQLDALRSLDRTGAGNQLDDFGLDLQRDLKLAISEYAPGSEVVAAGYVWRSAGLKVYPDRRLPETAYYACPCGAFQIVAAGATPEKCPHCGESHKHSRTGRYIKPEFGFVTSSDTPQRASTRRPARQYSSRIAFAEFLGSEGLSIERWPGVFVSTPRQARLVTINSGRANRGFRICQSCGFGEPVPYGPIRFSRDHTSPRGTTCRGEVTFGVDLGHDFITDVLELRLNPLMSMRRADWWSIAYAVAEGASSALGIKREDLDVTVRLAPQGGYSVFLLDSVPGGAGHVVRVHEHLSRVAWKALDRVSNCRCEETTSCYECLRTFSNQRMHAQLIRGVATRFLEQALNSDAADRRADARLSADALSLVRDEALQTTVRDLVARGVPLPEIGYEVVDDYGEVMGEIEVAWPVHEVGVVLDGSKVPQLPGWRLWSAAELNRSPDDLERMLMFGRAQ